MIHEIKLKGKGIGGTKFGKLKNFGIKKPEKFQLIPSEIPQSAPEFEFGTAFALTFTLMN